MTTPITSAWAAIASIVLAAVSNIRMVEVSNTGGITGKRDMMFVTVMRNFVARYCGCVECNCALPKTRAKMVSTCFR